MNSIFLFYCVIVFIGAVQGQYVSAQGLAQAITQGSSAFGSALAIVGAINSCQATCGQCSSGCGKIVVEAISFASVTAEGSDAAAKAFAEALTFATGPAQVKAYAEVIAEALSAQGPAAKSVAQAATLAKAMVGCQFIAPVLTEAEGLVEGKGSAAAEAFASASMLVKTDDCLTSTRMPGPAETVVSGAVLSGQQMLRRGDNKKLDPVGFELLVNLG